jgi:Family of unknown function (DUF5722)
MDPVIPGKKMKQRSAELPRRRGSVSCPALCVWLSLTAHAGEIAHISATKDRINITGRAGSEAIGIAELAPYQSTNDLPNAPSLAQVKAQGAFHLSLPRWDGDRDRLYSGFLAYAATHGARLPEGAIHFVEDMRGVAKYDEPFPRTASKKGLQVQMVDDAIVLGVKHAALNVDLAGLIELSSDINVPAWQLDGVTYRFHRPYIENLDQRIKPLSDAGIVVTLILLDYQTGNPAVDRIMLHPRYSSSAPHRLSAFNTATADGLRYFKAIVEFLTDRYSLPHHPYGRAVNFIVGNEVNAHWYWSNLGDASMEDFAADYLRTVRVCNTAVHKISAAARVYISLEHHWNIRMEDPMHTFAGRNFIDCFNQHAVAGGNFDWNLAYHPYPEDLRNPRTWNDKTATLADDTPRITFKNIEMLPRYFRRAELLYHGKPRHIILSEQGFNTLHEPDGESLQAAAYCYAYYKTARLPGIDAFILHRHVDHRDEDGLNLGLWRRNENSPSPSEPATRKMIYEVFRLADAPQWAKAFAFALPVIGIDRWDELDPKP